MTGVAMTERKFNWTLSICFAVFVLGVELFKPRGYTEELSMYDREDIDSSVNAFPSSYWVAVTRIENPTLWECMTK